MRAWHCYLVIVLLMGRTVSAVEEQRPYVEVARFQGDALAAVSMTFDDAFPSQIEKAIPLYDKYGLHATFFVHTDNIKSTWASTWDAWKVAAATGHEVASHSKTHPNLTQVKSARRRRSEIKGSADLIEQNIGIRPISFAYPFSAANDAVQRQVRDVYLFDRSDCRMWGGQGFGADTGIRNIEQAVKNGTWFYCMMHGVDEVSFRPITAKALAGIIAYLAAHRDTIWTETYGTVGCYVRERTLADLKYKAVSTTSFEVRLVLPKDVASADKLTIPLTLLIALDEHNGAATKAYRGGAEVPATLSRDGKSILVDVIPDGTWTKVVWGQ